MTAAELRESPCETAAPSVERFELETWRTRYGVVAGITSRAADFTLNGAPPTGTAAASWEALGHEFARDFPAVVVGYQSHGTAVLTHQAVSSPWTAWPDVDGHVTGERGLLLAVTVADCVPVYLAVPDRPVVGLLHAGWRGLAAGIIEAGVAAIRMLSEPSSDAIVSHCGIAICGDCYEVGPEVVLQVKGERATGPSRLDLREQILARLGRLGAADTTSSPWCTVHDGSRFHSHRGSHGRAGRMLAYVGMPSLDPASTSR